MVDVYNDDMRVRLVSAVAIWALGACAAAAQDSWSCSVVDVGKPQVIKLTVGKSTVSMSDRRSRLLAKLEVNKTDATTLTLIADSKDALVAVSDVRFTDEPGTTSDVSIDTVVIDKRTGALTITTASTSTKPVELKGRCTP